MGRKKEIPYESYVGIYRDSRNVNLNIGISSDEKRNILRKYFFRFTDQGVQPVSKMGNIQVGVLFVNMIDYAIKIVSKGPEKSPLVKEILDGMADFRRQKQREKEESGEQLDFLK